MSKKILLAVWLAVSIILIAGCSQTNERVAAEKVVTAVTPSSSILFFGDIMLDRQVKKQIDKNGADYLFSKLDEEQWFHDYNLISANLEGPFANRRRSTSKSIAFRFDPKLMPTLLKYNFQLLSQANNHSLDMGKAGFKESLTNLNSAGLWTYGNQNVIDASSTIIKTVGDYRIAFIGINDTIYHPTLKQIKATVAQAKTQSDWVVVNIHWGDEYKTTSNKRQKQLGHALVEAGADVVIGHHPHVIEEMEIYQNRPIFYSLGNFIFDQYWSAPTQKGLGVGVIFQPGEIILNIYPLQSVLSQPGLMAIEQSTKFFKDWLKSSHFDINNGQLQDYYSFIIKLQ